MSRERTWSLLSARDHQTGTSPADGFLSISPSWHWSKHLTQVVEIIRSLPSGLVCTVNIHVYSPALLGMLHVIFQNGPSCYRNTELTRSYFKHERIFCRIWNPLGNPNRICEIPDFVVRLSASVSVIYRVSQEEWTKLRESVPYAELYRYNPKHLVYKVERLRR